MPDSLGIVREVLMPNHTLAQSGCTLMPMPEPEDSVGDAIETIEVAWSDHNTIVENIAPGTVL